MFRPNLLLFVRNDYSTTARHIHIYIYTNIYIYIYSMVQQPLVCRDRLITPVRINLQQPVCHNSGRYQSPAASMPDPSSRRSVSISSSQYAITPVGIILQPPVCQTPHHASRYFGCEVGGQVWGPRILLRLMFNDFGRRWIKKGEGYAYLRQRSPVISEPKKKYGIFVDP